MTKKNKIILITGLCSLIGITVTAATAIPLASSNKPVIKTINNKPVLMSDIAFENNKPFQFNNKVYLSLSDAYKELVNSIGGIHPKQYIGDFSNENSNGLIPKDKTLFDAYDINKISLVYQDANGRFVNDYDKAIKTFINASNIVTQYSDFKGNYFLDEEEAKESIKNFKTMGVACYEVLDENQRPVKINPLNNEDILTFKKIAINSLIKKANSSIQTPFNFKVIKTNNNTFDKNSELDNGLKSDYINMKNKIFEVFCSKLKNIIIDILKNNKNQFFQVQISIKPYRVHDDRNEKAICNVDYNLPTSSYRSESLYFWKFGGETWKNNGYLNLVSKNLNYQDAIELMKIYSNREEFKKYYDISTYKSNSAGWSPNIEIATAKNELSKFFNNFDISKYSITSNIEKPNVNGIWNYKTVAAIMEKTDNYWETAQTGPDYCNDTILTFGLRPYISPDKIKEFELKVKNKMDNKFLLDVITETKNKLLFNNEDQSSNQSIKLLDFLIENKNTFIANVNTNNFKIISSNNQNLFNVDLLNGLDISDSYSNDRNSNLCNKTPGSNNTVNEYTDNYLIFNNSLLNVDNCQKKLKDKFWEFVNKSPSGNVDSHLFELSETIADWRIIERYISVKNNNTITETECHEKVKTFDFLGFNSVDDSSFVSQYFNIYSNDQNKNTIFDTSTSRYISHFPNGDFKEDFENIIDFDSLIRSAGKINEIGFNYNIDNYLDNFSYIITYNDAPVFKINNDFLKTLNTGFKKEITDLFYGSELSIKQGSYNFSNLASIANSESNNNQRNIINNLIENISKNVTFLQSPNAISKSEFSTNYNYNPQELFDWNDYFLKNNYKVPYKTLPMMSNNSYASDNKYFNGALDAIALLRKNYFSLYSTNQDATVNQLLSKNQPNDFLMLYSKYGNTLLPEPLIHTEVLLGANNFNPSLTNHSFNDDVIFDKKQKEDLKLSFDSIYNPQKVYFIYTGPNLINPKPITDADVSSNPGYIDTPELIIENALRTYWLRSDPNYICYKDGNKSYIYKNKVRVLYNFTLNNQQYLFSSFTKAQSAVVEYIKSNSYEV